MSKKVTKVDGSVDEKNGLEYTVGDKSLGLLSTTIDKALVLKGEETQLKCSPEYADKTATEKAESGNVVSESVSDHQVLSEKAVVKKAAEEKMTIEKSTVANVAAEEGNIPIGDTHGHFTTWCRCECTAGGSGSSPRANVGDR